MTFFCIIKYIAYNPEILLFLPLQIINSAQSSGLSHGNRWYYTKSVVTAHWSSDLDLYSILARECDSEAWESLEILELNFGAEISIKEIPRVFAFQKI